ncbi:MAG: hypothetical protein ACFFEF_19760 [Candidatus Thorarchaeota archaeon]
MEPIGTITQYFPFLDEETRDLLQSVMNDAENYHDFVMHLANVVLNEDVPDLAIYFAIHHSALILDMDNIESIGKKYGQIPILRPNLFYARVHQGNVDDLPKIHESADAVLATGPPEWLAIEMRFLKFEADLLQYPKTLCDSANLEELERLIRKSPDYKFFENILFDCYRERAFRDGDLEEKIRCTDLAIRSAQEFNDLVRLAWHLRVKTDYLRRVNVAEARNTLTQAYQIMDSLGNRAGIASILLYLARLDATRGEYDLAIERCLKSIEIREKMDLPRSSNAVLLSTLYNAIGHADEGLEWARYAEVDFDVYPGMKPRAIFNQAWALALLGRTTEAIALVDSIRADVMMSGLDPLLAWLSFVTGVLDMVEGNLTSAASNIKDALDLFEEKSSVEYGLIFLYYLAQIDVRRVSYDTDSRIRYESLPWLTLLEEKSKSDDLPGFLGLASLLKAKLAISRDDDDMLRSSVEIIRNLCNSNHLDFLDLTLDSLLKKR